MNSIKILGNGYYLPEICVNNSILNDKFGVDDEFIYKRTGIRKRFNVGSLLIEDLAIRAVSNLMNKDLFDDNDVDMIIVGTTSTNLLMPGISYAVQKFFNIKDCMCMDILAGCNGFINAFDIARSYIALGKIKKAIVIGVEVLSNYVDSDDLGTAILLSDGAGATLIGKSEDSKLYESVIESDGVNGDILVCKSGEKIYMDGKEIYKYAVTDTVMNVKKLLSRAGVDLDDIKYIVPHQSNVKIINSIASKLGVGKERLYTNIENVGNTFCASIPIALGEMYEKGLLQSGDKIVLLGYGGGLNTGGILIEV